MKVGPALILTMALAAPAIHAAEAGKQLHDKDCHQCHDDGIYTRSNSIIHSLPELKARVEFCERANEKHWTPPQIQQVVEYLNQTFYKFPTQ